MHVKVFLGIVILLLSGCASQPISVIPIADLPESGDAANGEVLYNTARGIIPTCASCHNPDAKGAPQLDEYASVAASRVEGQSAREYTFYSIVEPWQHITEGYGNAMYHQYDENYSPQEIADLIAYLINE